MRATNHPSVSSGSSGSLVGPTRNLTSIYMKYRAEFKARKHRFAGSFLRPVPSARDDVEMDLLPPRWVDCVTEAQESISKIRERISQLQKAQQKRLRQVFTQDDKSGSEIEALSTQISALFKKAEADIRGVQTTGGDMGMSSKELILRENAQRKLAIQLQGLSGDFRQTQKQYLEGLKSGNNVWDDSQVVDSAGQAIGGPRGSAGVGGGAIAGGGLSEGALLQLDDVDFNVTHRTEEIKKIAQSVTELHTLFKELAVLVIDQGTMLDRIDYNIEQVVHQSKEANVQLAKAEEAHKSSRAGKCIRFLVIAIIIEILLLMLKWS